MERMEHMEHYEGIRRLASLLADSPEPAFVVALDGTIVRWNAAAAELFGIPAWAAVGRFCPAVVGGRTVGGQTICRAGCAVLQEAGAGRSAAALEMVIRGGSPTRGRRVAVHLVALKDPTGQPQGVLHLVEDVDKRRRHDGAEEPHLALAPHQANGKSLLSAREREVF